MKKIISILFVLLTILGACSDDKVPVVVTGVSLNVNSYVLKEGETAVLAVTITPADAENKNVVWTSSNEHVATVASDGKITAVSAGTAIITVKSVDGGFTASCAVTVEAKEAPKPEVVPVSGVALDKAELTMVEGTIETLLVTITPAEAENKKVTWTTSDEKVATIAADGKVTAVSPGTATITVKTEDGDYTATCTVTVTKQVVSVSGVSLDKNEAALVEGEMLQLIATVAPAEADNKIVTWSTSDEKVATVAADGTITAVSPGTATITVKTEDGGFTATCAVTVNKKVIAVTGVLLNKDTANMAPGEVLTLTATVLPDNADCKNVTWTSSNPNVATVDADGKVTALDSGTAIITVTTADGAFQASCKVIVYQEVFSVTLDKTEANIDEGKTLQLTATVAPENATDKTLKWESSNTAVATVSDNGLVTGVKAGEVTITVIAVDSGKKATCLIHVIGGAPGTTESGSMEGEGNTNQSGSMGDLWLTGTGNNNNGNS